MTKQSVSAVGDSPTNEELVFRFQSGDPSAPELLLRQNSGYLTTLAIRYGKNLYGSSLTEDLKQEGAIALLGAAKRFDSTFGNRFLTYATPAIRAAMLDYAARNALPLSIPTGRYHQLRQVRRLIIEDENVPETALIQRIMEQLGVSQAAARGLLLECQALFQSVDLGEQVFEVSGGGDPAKVYDRYMRRVLLLQRMEEVLSPRELNLVRYYLRIGQPEEQGMTFQELAVRLNYNGPSGAEKAYKNAIRKLRKQLNGGAYGRWLSIQKAIRRARAEAEADSGCYAPPQMSWVDEKELSERFFCEVISLNHVHAIFSDALEQETE